MNQVEQLIRNSERYAKNLMKEIFLFQLARRLQLLHAWMLGLTSIKSCDLKREKHVS